MLQNQTTIFIVVGVIIAIVVAVIIYFVMKNKKDNYENFNMIENYEEQENEEIKNYLISDYALKYVENFELLNLNNTKFTPVLTNHLNRVIHVADLISRGENLEIIKKEAGRVGLNKRLIDRVLTNHQTAKKFAVNVHAELNNKYNTIGKILKNVASEHLEEIKDQLPNKVEKFTENYQLEKGSKLFSNRIRKQNHSISNLKKNLHHKLLNNPSRLAHDQEVTQLARKANVNKHVLNKILSSPGETENFIQNITTLEHYDPLNYIENYHWGGPSSIAHAFSSAWHAVSHAVSHVAEEAVHGVESVAKTVEHGVVSLSEDVEKGIVKAAEWVGSEATVIGDKIKDGVLSVIKDVAAAAEAAFNAVKAGVLYGIDEIKKGIMFLVNLVGDIWEKIKALMMRGVDMLINFVKSEIRHIVSQFFRVNDGCPTENKQLPCHTYEVNSKKIHNFLLHRFENIVLVELGPVITILEEIPFVGGKVRQAIDELMNPIFDLAYNPLQGVINSLINTIIHRMAPNSNNVVLEFTEWFTIEDYYFDIDGLKDNILDNIDKVNKLEDHSPKKCDLQCKLMHNIKKSHMSCLNSCIKTIPYVAPHNRENMRLILKNIVKDEHQKNIGKILNELILIVKDK